MNLCKLGEITHSRLYQRSAKFSLARFAHEVGFAPRDDVVNHYNTVKKLHLTNPQHADLIEYLESL
jgi:hypothetical protein